MKSIEHLKGLRGLAAFVVVISHYMQFYHLDSFYKPGNLIKKYTYNISFAISFSISIIVTFVQSYFMYKNMDSKAINLSKVIQLEAFQKK